MRRIRVQSWIKLRDAEEDLDLGIVQGREDQNLETLTFREAEAGDLEVDTVEINPGNEADADPRTEE